MDIQNILLAEISGNIKALQLQLDYERSKLVAALGGEPVLYDINGVISENRMVCGQYGGILTGLLNDDSVFSFTPHSTSGILFLHQLATTYAAQFCVWAFRCGGTIINQKITSGALVDCTTGALTGTTGIDGHMTLSVHSDQKIYIETRLGGQNYGMSIAILGGGYGI